MNPRTRFIYVDAMIGRSAWRRVKEADIDTEIRQPAKNFNCFSTVQRFSEPAHPATGDEPQWSGIYFDLDSNGDVELARLDTIKIVQFFMQFGVPKAHVRVWFSGKKGFHVVVEPEVCDIQPHPKLAYIVRMAAVSIGKELGVTTLDESAYSVRRLLRLANSVHQDTRLYKIELHHSELQEMSLEQIREFAKKPRDPIFESDEYRNIATNDTAARWWLTFVEAFDESVTLKALEPREPIQRPPISDLNDASYPACVKSIFKSNTLPKSNTGNRTVMALASFFKDAGLVVDEAEKRICDWIQSVRNIGDAGDPARAIAMARSTVRYVYNHADNYRFACRFIRSIGTKDRPVDCTHLLCPWIGGTEQEPKEIAKIDLSRTGDSAMQNVFCEVPVRVSGKVNTPYVVPKKIKITCMPSDCDMCLACKIQRFGGNFEMEFGPRHAVLLETFNVTRLMQKANIRNFLGVPKQCDRNQLITTEEQNVEEVRLVPPAQEFGAADKREYVVRKGYFIGHPIESNKAYKIRGYPTKEPKSQAATIIFKDTEKMASEIEKFKMTPEIREQLKVFQTSDMDVLGKFDEIHDDFEANVTGIWNRRTLSFCMDLVWHSVRGFQFHNQEFVKGWAELAVVGDSGSGKTTMANAFRKHYRVGELVSGGSARRTGLAYSIQELSKTWMLVWGILPLNDLGLVIIDEFGDLREEDFALLTDARSSGIIRVAAVVQDETNARVRLIVIANPREGKTIGAFDFGCQALENLIHQPEDIRRFDMAMVAASGDVTPEILNRKVKPECKHTYTSYLCSELLKWAWSRMPDQIVFTPDATSSILDSATAISKEYASGSIPLAEPADIRFKIARLSAAAAARLFSTDESGEKVIVHGEHVLFAVHHLRSCYNHPHFRYDMWSRREKERNPDAPKVDEIRKALRAMDDWERVRKVLKDEEVFSLKDLQEMCGLDSSDATKLVYHLRSMTLITKAPRGYRKTPLMIQTLQGM